VIATTPLSARFGKYGTVIRYLALGGLAAAVNWGSRFAWNLVMPFSAAVAVAYLTGMVVAFLLFRAFVFPGSLTPLHQQVRNFVLVNLLGIAQTWIISIVLVDKVFPALNFKLYPEAIGHGFAIAAPVLTSWFGHRRFTFAQGESPD
jgi:putative flippase GtrA